jgi:hypothetical protein
VKKLVIRDRDKKFGAEFDRAAGSIGTRVIKTAVRTPNMNSNCERFLGSVRRECLDQVLALSERQLLSIVHEYVQYYNRARPHQALGQRSPLPCAHPETLGRVISLPVLGGFPPSLLPSGAIAHPSTHWAGQATLQVASTTT